MLYRQSGKRQMDKDADKVLWVLQAGEENCSEASKSPRRLRWAIYTYAHMKICMRNLNLCGFLCLLSSLHASTFRVALMCVYMLHITRTQRLGFGVCVFWILLRPL